MRQESQHKQLAAKLRPKQQTLEFANSRLWEQLPKSDQQACRDALARLLCQVIQSNQDTNEHE